VSAFSFPAPRRPDVSIVLPVFGQWEWLTRTLGALLANTAPCYELIVVDNASPDESAGHLAAIAENVRIIQNPTNLGFGLACNQGAAAARGEFLVFLNSDALVHDGWLPPLLEAAADRRVGAVGPCFLNLDGTIQEAGALLYADATTRGYVQPGPDAQADAQRARIVDYASAACLLVKRRAFDEVGGFDPVYSPAYYEDVDLCLALASAGYLTAYEPRSVVTHAGGWSNRTGVESALILGNQAFFARRWSGLLALRPVDLPGARDVIVARDAPLSDRLLIVTEHAPARGSRGAELIRTLASVCLPGALALLCEHGPPAPGDELPGVERALWDAESATDSAWLSARRFHYDSVLSIAPRQRHLEQAVLATQPQASWLLDLDPDAVALIASGGTVDRLESADAVLVASEDDRRALDAKRPELPIFVVGDDDGGRRSLTELFVHFGYSVAA
jgi:GT2 family glycosyltransferase